MNHYQFPNFSFCLIPALPFLGFLINGLLGRRFPKWLVTTVALGSTLASFVAAAWVASNFFAHQSDAPFTEIHRHWIQISGFNVNFEFYLDQLSMVMTLIVTGVGFLIHVYSAGYMEHEGGYYRFFSYLNLFMFFMLMLVLSGSYLLMFVGWEGVGLASYLLIGFFFLKDSAANAGKKAFITNRIGDFGFLIAMFLLINQFGNLDFANVFQGAANMPVEHSASILTWIAIGLLIGATGKSAQIPLYVWLPDAMEGPTPVSALIHAATMVTAGIYMVARSSPIFDRAPIALTVVAIIGALTAFFAATIGITQTDIKRVLAYSTISQLGYMFMACGVAAYSAGIFHLMTHAFFKALLFLAAGSVIHAMGGEQDMRNMGGLKKYIPVTFWTMTIATFAIAGFWPLAGFFSKDEILFQAFLHGRSGKIFWLIGLITAGITSFYMFRLWFMTFFGKLRQPQQEAAGHGDDHGHGHEPHESPWIMLGPLVILAILSIVGGWVGIGNRFEGFLKPVFEQYAPPQAHLEIAAAATQAAEEASRSTELLLAGVSVLVAAVGLFFAWFLYYKHPEKPALYAAKFRGLYNLVYNKYFVDEAYGALFTRPLLRFSTNVLWRGIDVGVIDATVNEAGTAAEETSQEIRKMQSGNLRSYAGWVAAGAAAVLVYMIWIGAR